MLDGIASLNELGGEGRPVPERPNAIQEDVLRNIEQAYAGLGPPDADCSPAGALGELCGSAMTYDGGRTDVVPYARERVSWPPPASSPMPMLSGLPADLMWLRSWQRHLLRSPAEADEMRLECGLREPYIDPLLKNNKRIYVDFLLRLEAGGMLACRLSHGRRGRLGLFCARKKDGISQRVGV